MTTPEVELRATWHHVVGEGHPEALDHLLGCHRQPHRRYHTATHVMWVLRHIDAIVRGGLPVREGEWFDITAVQLAALFHDAVYVPTRTDNEALSAELAARRAAEFGWPAVRCAAVHRLVLATAHHTPTSLDEEVLIDADLAILGADPNEYAAYAAGVRAEYRHVATPQWRVGRAQVLRTFLATPVVFHTDVMHRAREARARANLTAELASLQSA
jgi:predicted metal-dependent HD superfamily phosphohydrolase